MNADSQNTTPIIDSAANTAPPITDVIGLSSPTIFYAIGDIHGMYPMLKKLVAAIEADIDHNQYTNYLIVFCGDYVDRGPFSKDVIDLIRSLAERRRVLALKGNHEDQLVYCYERRDSLLDKENVDSWMANYGARTTNSFKAGSRDPADIPLDYVKWMHDLPVVHADRLHKVLFVHAGVDPITFPEIHERTALWTRSSLFMDTHNWDGTKLADWLVVHGHTINRMPFYNKRRINVDTGACHGGDLTSVKLDMGDRTSYHFIAVDGDTQEVKYFSTNNRYFS